MKVALVNNNPAVSRLATLSLSKIGCEYVEVASLDMLDSGLFDVLIIDSDIEVDKADLKDFANKILYLASKNSPEFSSADKVLFKPFLPTEFVSIMEKLSPKEEEPTEEEKFEDTKDFVKPLQESEFVDEFSDEIFDDSLPELEDIKDNDLMMDDVDLVDEVEADSFDELKTKDDSFTQELSELVQSIDDMQESIKDENLNQTDEVIQSQMLAREEELLKEFGFSDDALEQEDNEAKEETNEEKFDDLMNELSLPAYDEELDVIESIKSDIDEIENLDTKFEEESQEATKELSAQEEFENEFAKEDIQNLAQEFELVDELVDNFKDEEVDIKNEAEFKLEEQELSSDTKDEDIVNKVENKKFEFCESDTTDYNDIDQISESDIKRALEDSVEEVVKERNEVDIKSELTNKISEQIATSLSVSSIKDALKGMNIKINITFEEK